MIRINQLKLPITHSEDDLYNKAARQLHIKRSDIITLKLVKQSVDARKKPDLYYSYTLDLDVVKAEKVISKLKIPETLVVAEENYQIPASGSKPIKSPPVIIGSGPAGLFCAVMLARAGYCPVLVERGEDVDNRLKKVSGFWDGGKLDPESNVQFGEGGAGTFSDGKLNTLVKDKKKRNQKVLELFVEFGADSEILYKNKPHLGTDVLSTLVKRMRTEIISLGGQVHFQSQVTDLLTENNQVTGIIINGVKEIKSNVVVLAVGHSARDTFEMLMKKNVLMEAKAFAVGLRIQHPQAMINQSQYGCEQVSALGASSYKLTRQTSTGRGVYSFCMCPGGYVVNASSEVNRLAVNGMSYHDRAGENANSALIVTVTPADFDQKTPMAGILFQRKLEEMAYQSGNGKIPIQLYGDFVKSHSGNQLGDVAMAAKGDWQFADLRGILPAELCLSLIEGMEYFGKVIHGFDRYDAILAGVESRTSAPVRTIRGDDFQSISVGGLYPCGEGAGYAGGITSAAMDGIKVAEAIISLYAPYR